MSGKSIFRFFLLNHNISAYNPYQSSGSHSSVQRFLFPFSTIGICLVRSPFALFCRCCFLFYFTLEYVLVSFFTFTLFTFLIYVCFVLRNLVKSPARYYQPCESEKEQRAGTAPYMYAIKMIITRTKLLPLSTANLLQSEQ